MRSSFINYFFAHMIPIATFGGAGILTAIVCWKVWPSVVSGLAPFSSLLAIITAFPLGMVLGYFVLGLPLFYVGRSLNGGPFREGDVVRILVGPYKGCIAKVCGVWSDRNEISVIFINNPTDATRHYFFVLKVCREKGRPAT